MAIPYDTYFKNAMSRYAPQREADIAQTSAGLADKGLLASTGGQGALGDIRSRYYATAANEANQGAQWQSAFDEQRKQAARQTALSWWDAINSLVLSKKNAGYNDRALYWANTPRWYKSYQTSGGLKYGDGKGEVMQPMHERMGDGKGMAMQPSMMKMMMAMMDEDEMGEGMMPGEGDEMPKRYLVGDGKGNAKQPSWVNYDAHQEDLGSSLAERQFSAQQDLAREQLDMERRRLSETIRQARASEKQNDPWYEMMSYVNSTTQQDKSPNVAGIQRAFLPSEVLNTAEGTWGFDVLDMAKNGDEKAVAVIKLLYPETWRQKLGLAGAVAAPVAGWRAPSQHAPASGFADSPGYALMSGPAGLVGGALRSGIESLGSSSGFRNFFGQQPGRLDLPGQENWWSRLFGGR